MTHKRSPLQDLNMRRSNHAPMDELHKTLEVLEQRLIEMTNLQSSPHQEEHRVTPSAKARLNLDEITAELDNRVSASASDGQFALLPNLDISFDEELARIENSVDILTAQNSEQNNDNMTLRHVRETAEQLQEELEALKRMMQTMAREETVRGLSHRWDQFDEKFEAFEQQHQKTNTDFPELNAISDRLEDVRRAIDAMPQMQAVSIQPLEERVSGLAQSIEHMISQREDNILPPVLDERLDEISRAILAGNMKRQDSDETRRAEALSQELLTRMAELSQRIDSLSESSSLPLQQIETLAKQIRLIATYIDKALESGPAQELEKVNLRLDDIARQLNSVESRFTIPQEAIFAALDQRFDALVLRLDEQFSQPSNPQSMQHLEAQIASIAQQLAEPEDKQQIVDNLTPRLEKIESFVEQTSEATLDIARKAAEAAMETFAARAHQYESNLIKELGHDMRALEELAKRNDERNEKSFETVHATLLKVVERLTALELHHKAGEQTETSSPIKPYVAPVKPLLSAVKSPVQTSADLSDVSAEPKSASLEEKTDLPDISALMKRVRGEPGLGSTLRQDKDQQADYISAARSAAQIAADEAGIEAKRMSQSHSAAKTPKKSTFTQLIARQRKPIFLGMSAIIVALAALQAGEVYYNQSRVSSPSQMVKTDLTVESVIDQNTVASIVPAEVKSEIAAVKQADDIKVNGLTPVAEETKSQTATSLITDATEPSHEGVTNDNQTSLNPLPEITAEAGPNALRQAASEGDTIALFEIGNRYTDGIGTKADLTKAATFYAAAAERGFAPAQYRYGNLNEKGIGLPRNIEKARHWYLEAARKGNASAMHNLAVLYATGGDIAPDNKAALEWFEKAAERDVKDSQYNLGILYAQGAGTQANMQESYKWFALAAQTGDKDAADKRDQVAKVLGQEKLKQAEDIVALWKPKALEQEANSVSIPESWTDENPVQTASVDMKKAVRNIQLILTKNGYDIGTADGMMGEKTRAAIKKFQTANGEEPTGEVNPQLVKLLLDHNR
ncbi:peptidoglycan-binding protein [Brucellaceae bacterium C25G]